MKGIVYQKKIPSEANSVPDIRLLRFLTASNFSGLNIIPGDDLIVCLLKLNVVCLMIAAKVIKI